MKNFKSKWGALIILLVLSVGIVAIFYFDNESNSKNYSDNKKTQNNGDKIIQNYTIDYLKDIKNIKKSVFEYLGMNNSYDVFEKIIKKYKLEPSNHLVDLIYEALVFEKHN